MNQKEPFYYISEKNFFDLFAEIHEISKIPVETEMYRELLYYKNNTTHSSIEEIPLHLGNDIKINKIYRSMLETNSGYLFLNILKTQSVLMKNQKLHKYITDAIVAVITDDNYNNAYYRGYYNNIY